jgi:hypothetical protein
MEAKVFPGDLVSQPDLRRPICESIEHKPFSQC